MSDRNNLQDLSSVCVSAGGGADVGTFQMLCGWLSSLTHANAGNSFTGSENNYSTPIYSEESSNILYISCKTHITVLQESYKKPNIKQKLNYKLLHLIIKSNSKPK